uniref:Uncharacterized protein n=1 Tax=Anguilla anguilla TaxID=7936 RepID=A0A0E9XNM0_ANGAN
MHSYTHTHTHTHTHTTTQTHTDTHTHTCSCLHFQQPWVCLSQLKTTEILNQTIICVA